MIKIVSVYAASDGQTFPNEWEAKAHELALLLAKDAGNVTSGDSAANWIVQNTEQVIAILTEKADAPPKRKPRSDKGRNHKRQICHGAAVAAENKEAA